MPRPFSTVANGENNADRDQGHCTLSYRYIECLMLDFHCLQPKIDQAASEGHAPLQEIAIGSRVQAKTKRAMGFFFANLRSATVGNVLAWTGLCFLSGLLPIWAQISPGPLSRAHRSLNSMGDCTTCHRISTGKPVFQCLQCHTEIASRIAAGKGLHASYNLKASSSRECIHCHSDHNGEGFQLIKWDIRTFDHKQTGYALEGKHAGLDCSKCHTSAHVSQSEVSTIKVTDLNKTFLGVSQECTTCHRDPHNRRLGPKCLSCHNFTDWKTIKIGKFDHSRTRYPLTGLHVQVVCQKCHIPGPAQKPRYTGIPFGKCTDCHSDPHHGGFHQSCQSCHSTAGWKRISRPELNQAFDHSKTKYPLRGKHADVECMKCHLGGDFKKPLVFQKCMDCHKDAHSGQFLQRPDRGACESCHTVDGFKPAIFGVKEHAFTSYPLEDRHAELECSQCHISRGEKTIYRMKFQLCTDCHRDPHARQFAVAPYFNKCEQCHTLKRYRPSTFTPDRHKKTRMPLTGGHVAVPCSDCHKQSDEFGPKPTATYHWQSMTCTTCHADPHKGHFDKLMREAGVDGKRRGCEACHSTESWAELSRFDHSKTAFPLLGAHRNTHCIRCHKPQSAEIKVANVDFRAVPVRCGGCHADVHGRQFIAEGWASCSDCHDSAQWKPSLFDHERTVFPLKGAHRKTPCGGCHTSVRLVDNRPVLFYKPTPKECSSCHARGIVGSKSSLPH